MEMRRPRRQNQEGSTPEHHVQMMRNMSRFSIKLGQVLAYLLPESNSIESTHKSHSLWFKGLWLEAGATVLAVAPSPFLAMFSLPPSVTSFLFLCHLPFRLRHQLGEHSKDHASAAPPRAPGWRQTLPWRMPGETLDMCGTCPVGPVPAHPGTLLDDGERGCGEGKAPVCVYNWGDTRRSCTINKQKRGCWMRWCLKQGRGFSGFMSGHRARRANKVTAPPEQRPQSKNVQLSPHFLTNNSALESFWVTQSWASGVANTTADQGG